MDYYSLIQMSIYKNWFYMIKNKGDSVVVGTVRNVHNLLSYGVVGKSVCRMWESCPLAFPCSVNGLFHDGIACYAHFHNACLLVFGFFGSE